MKNISKGFPTCQVDNNNSTCKLAFVFEWARFVLEGFTGLLMLCFYFYRLMSDEGGQE